MTIYITYYTTGSPYENLAKNLEESLNKFNLKNRIYEKPDKGSWAKNVWYKSGVILDTLKEYKEPVVWLDADAEVVKDPSKMFDSLTCDLGVHVRTRKEGWSIFASTLYFGYTPMGLEIAEEWDKRSIKREMINPKLKIPAPYYKPFLNWCLNEQGTLINTYWDMVNSGKKVNLFDLPKPYACKIDSSEKERYIIQYQASRYYAVKRKEKDC